VSEYPDLFRPRHEPGATRLFIARDDLPPEELIANAYLVPRLGSSWLYFVEENGALQFPGGVKRPGETHRQAIERCLLGAVGARLESFRLIGRWTVRADSAKSAVHGSPPPDSCDVVGCGHVQLVGSPASGAEGGQTLEVRVAPLHRVVASFVADDQRDVADLYRLAAALSA
jgi:hypothetical protein